MAIAYGGVTNHWRAYMDYSTSQSDTAVSFTIKGGFQSQAWGFAINGVSCTISATGQSNATATGSVSIGSGATAMVQIATKSFSVNRTHSAQSISLKTVTSNQSGYMNGTSTASATVTVPAKASWTVSYNANGGSGAPGNQTKWYGEALTLSSVKPTRDKYNFLGWATSANGSVAYKPGASYTGNSATTLYAVWELAYIAPTISGTTAIRCDLDGFADDEGTYAKLTASWAVDTSLDPSNKATSLEVEYKEASSSSWDPVSSTNPNAASGSVNLVFGAGGISTEKAYDIRIVVGDSGGYSADHALISQAFYLMDIRSTGKGIAFGQPCTDDGFWVSMPGTLALSGNARGGSWVEGRDNANLRQTTRVDNGYCPAVSVKTQNGSWEIGAYQNENLYFTLISDANHNNNTNTPSCQIELQSNGTLPVKNGGTGATSKINALKNLGLYCGSKVITKTATTYQALFTDAQYKAITGRSYDSSKDGVYVFNGDEVANSTRIISSGYRSSDKSIYIQYDTSGSASSLRVNYLIVAP